MSGANELQPTPEGALIRLARQARGMSPEVAADLTPVQIKGGRWRQIESGFDRKNPPKRSFAPALTLAHMAHTVGTTPERLAEAGRDDAAAILREILRGEGEEPANPETLTTREQQMLAEMVASTAEGFDLTPEQLDAAYRRAVELIKERQAARSEDGKGVRKDRAS
ncbi:hypothetical protein [Streptomyces sp. NBC_00986]|uniref:hypothetical protein n=1 Tax=Streptomyces sp. NBC_00986 TaxID=2903702 RepID=UPI00386AA293|nr:hypothetical protein OG504_45320 [Streptomyces sp. NBC_00986]